MLCPQEHEYFLSGSITFIIPLSRLIYLLSWQQRKIFAAECIQQAVSSLLDGAAPSGRTDLHTNISQRPNGLPDMILVPGSVKLDLLQGPVPFI